MGGALAVAVDPTNPSRLLLGTESGLLSSSNGGRDWDLVSSETLAGPVLAVAFGADGTDILAASGSGLAHSADGVRWQAEPIPGGASPTRGLIASATPGAFYLVGWQGLFRTETAGATWLALDAGLPTPTVTRLLVTPTGAGSLMAVDAGDVWLSRDDGQRWEPRGAGLPNGKVQAIALDPRSTTSLWAAGTNRLFRSADGGAVWEAVGRPLPEADTEIRAIAVDSNDGNHIVLSTHRGIYASRDGANTWDILTDNLPAHIEAGPLVRDHSEPAVLYTGFSVIPYDEAWQSAAARSSALVRLAGSELVGGVAFIVLIGLGGGLALRWLARRTRAGFAGEPGG